MIMSGIFKVSAMENEKNVLYGLTGEMNPESCLYSSFDGLFPVRLQAWLLIKTPLVLWLNRRPHYLFVYSVQADQTISASALYQSMCRHGRDTIAESCGRTFIFFEQAAIYRRFFKMRHHTCML